MIIDVNNATPTASCRHNSPLGICVLALACSMIMNSAAMGAGCHYFAPQADEAYAGHPTQLTEFYWWTTGPVTRVYANGRISYYQTPDDGLPCQGLHCRAKDQSTTSTVALNIQNDRIPLQGSLSSSRLCDFGASGRPRPSSVIRPPAPIADGPLRPPCC